ncbi:DUF302 domain-containing protein [Christiangramia sp. LLG6405-1]|uniref:DUF302 domain-containing protein n=1 Tax=Christiangramia sp. LLG6405-1 TaxID=3160832 RepID=UPI003865C38F
MKKMILVMGLLAGFSSCSQSDQDEILTTDARANTSTIEVTDLPIGVKYAESQTGIAGSYNRLKQSLQKNEAISIVAEVDHSANAKSIGEELDYTSIIFFGNPVLGTPLMQRNQLAGLDLPQKVLFFKDAEKNELALYNSVEYLSSRHGLEGVSTLPKISGALENLVSAATKSEVEVSPVQPVDEGEGVVTKTSNQNFEDTYSDLKVFLQNNPDIKIVAELDHQANAASVGLDLRSTKIIIFGNPNLGTPLMQKDQSIGLDLPQKMLVWEDADGKVSISYNDPFFIAERHGITNSDDVLNKIKTALETIAENAATSD